MAKAQGKMQQQEERGDGLIEKMIAVANGSLIFNLVITPFSNIAGPFEVPIHILLPTGKTLKTLLLGKLSFSV